MGPDHGVIAQLKQSRHVLPYGVAAAVVLVQLALHGTLADRNAPLVVAAAGTWLCVGTAARHLVTSALAAAALSIGVSLVIDWHDLSTDLLLRRTIWLVVVELAALGLLATWSVRTLRRVGSTTVVGAMFVAMLVLVAERQASDLDSYVRTGVLLGLGGCVAAGVLLRDIDEARIAEAMTARHEERLAIARELHDVVAHHVTGIVVQAQAAQVVAATKPEATMPALASIERAGADALTAMRRMVGALRDDDAAAPIVPSATVRDLRALANAPVAVGVPVNVRLDNADDLPAEIAASVHRIATEAITNAQRHAVEATRVDVTVTRVDNKVDVVVRDDGRTVRADRRGGGFGLVGMGERVHALGGLLVAGPVQGGGWQVHATFPMKAPMSSAEAVR